MQLRTHYQDGVVYQCEIEDADREVMPGVLWGDVSRPFTPAFWRFFCLVRDVLHDQQSYRLGKTLREELVACLLGGHGISGELGNAAYQRVRGLGLIDRSCVTAQEIETALSQPLDVKGRKARYRFPKQKAKFIAAALNVLDHESPPEASTRQLRDWLTLLPGIGMKTASWIVRNWLDAPDVAILDIHIHRAGVIAGIFSPEDDVAKSYRKMEDQFLIFSRAIGVPANALDNQIWNELRVSPNVVREFLLEKGVTQFSKCGLPYALQPRSPQTTDMFAVA